MVDNGMEEAWIHEVKEGGLHQGWGGWAEVGLEGTCAVKLETRSILTIFLLVYKAYRCYDGRGGGGREEPAG